MSLMPAGRGHSEYFRYVVAAQKRSLPAIRWSLLAYGFILGVLVWTAALRLGIDAIPDFRSPHIVVASGLLGALLAHTRLRVVFGLASALVCLALLTVMYTPLAERLLRGIVREDRLQPVPAVVVLASEIHDSGELTDRSLARLFYAFQILRQGAAGRLVLTRRDGFQRSSRPAVERLMEKLRFSYPIDETGATENTHDEAIGVCLIARKAGWSRVILVSHPSHMRRASAVFEKEGLPVYCAPCPEGRYDITSLRQPEDRLLAFRDWLHEALGYEIYRIRGWVE